MKKKELDYTGISSAMNIMLKERRDTDLTYEELYEIVGNCIPLKSKIGKIITEMVIDGVLTKHHKGQKVYYHLISYPIYKDRIKKWVDNVRAYNASKKISNTTPEEFLRAMNTQELCNFLKPICEEKMIKLYAPAGYDEGAIAKLPKEILSQIVKMKEV